MSARRKLNELGWERNGESDDFILRVTCSISL